MREDASRAAATPAAMSIAGQITQWNRMMSLPTKWYCAGQYCANSLGSVGSSLP